MIPTDPSNDKSVHKPLKKIIVQKHIKLHKNGLGKTETKMI